MEILKNLNRTGASGEERESGVNNPTEDVSRKKSSCILGQLETGGSRRVNSRALHSSRLVLLKTSATFSKKSLKRSLVQRDDNRTERGPQSHTSDVLQGLCGTERLLSHIYKHGVRSVIFNNLKMIKKKKVGKSDFLLKALPKFSVGQNLILNIIKLLEMSTSFFFQHLIMKLNSGHVMLLLFSFTLWPMHFHAILIRSHTAWNLHGSHFLSDTGFME